MYVKAHLGDGHWKLWDVDSDLEYQGQRSFVLWEVPNDGLSDALPEGIPYVHADVRHVHPHVEEQQDSGPPLVHWVAWITHDARHLLITSGDVYLMNEQGQTIESLRGAVD